MQKINVILLILHYQTTANVFNTFLKKTFRYFATFFDVFNVFLYFSRTFYIAASGHRETTTASSRRHLSGGRGLLSCVMSS